jgi:hypothetical protein
MPALLTKGTLFACPLTLLLAIAAAPSARAQDQPAAGSYSEAAKIISQNVKASGGSHALSRVRTLSLQGMVAASGDAPTGSFTLDVKSPNRYYSELNLGNRRFIEAFNGKSAWRLDSSASPATMLGPDTQEMVVEAQIASSHLLNLKKDALAASLVGHAQVAGNDALEISVTSPFGATHHLFFDADSHLLVKDSAVLDGVPIEFVYSSYSRESGVQVPHHLAIRRGDESFDVTISSAEVNGPIGERIFDVPIRSQVKLPDMKALFKEIDANQKAMDELRHRYAGTKVEEDFMYRSPGQVKSHDSKESNFFYMDSEEIDIVRKRNGKPLADADAKAEEESARKRVEAIRKSRAEEAAKKEKEAAAAKDSGGKDSAGQQPNDADNDSGKDGDKDDSDVGIEMFLRIDEFVNPRRERFRGQDVLVFDFEANPEHKPHGFTEKIVQKLAGTIWIDEKAHDVIRLEAFFARDEKILGGLLATIGQGTAYVFEQEYFDNSVWLPTYEEVYFGVRVLMVKGFHGSTTTRYSNYSKFDVDAAYPPKTPAPRAASATPPSATPQ